MIWLAWLGCGEEVPCDGVEYVAMARDFESYRHWKRYVLQEPDLRLGTGARTVYIDPPPPRDATVFPLCTRIVKVGEEGDDPTEWLMVAMAKRGGDYNADGAVGWEWFDLDLTDRGVPAIEWRGPVPPEGRGYECALGEDDGGVEIGDCNTCHAASANDAVLTAELALD